MYNFGLTKADREIRDQWVILQSTETVTNTENDSIAEYHKKICPETNFAHLQKIDDLQHANEALIKEIKLKDSVIYHLDSIINNMRNNADNFYAMPFSIEFDNNSYTVRQDQYEKLKQVAYLMNSDTTTNYNICGYCDYTGSAEYNQKLSEKRAEEVKRLLVERCGVKEEQLTTSGKGKDVAFGDIKSPVNRRVSFFKQF
jgi:outer membrane protein OmpA-like peptidoglycan-associated protein